MATRKSDCLSSSGHENTALLLCRAAVWCQRVAPSFPAATYSPFLPFFLTLFHFPSVLSVLITCCEPGIDHSTTSARLFLPDSSPCSPAPCTHRLVKLFIISSARFQSVPSHKSSSTSTCDDFKECSRIIQSWSYRCLLHLCTLQSR